MNIILLKMPGKNSRLVCLILMLFGLSVQILVAQNNENDYDDYYKYDYTENNKKLKILHHDNFYNLWDSTLFFYKDDKLISENFFGHKNTSYINYAYDTVGRVLWEYHSDVKTKYYFKYDQKGNLKYKLKKQDSSQIVDTVETYLYDAESKLISEKTIRNTRSGIKVFQWHQYTFDDEGHIEVKKSFRPDGSLIQIYHKSYNADGKLSLERIYDDHNVLTDSLHYDYNSKDSLVGITYYKDKVLSRKEEWNYNETGQVIHTDCFYNIYDGEISSSFTTVKKYDAKKRILEKICYDQMFVEIEIIE